jgi:hypothetical protein
MAQPTPDNAKADKLETLNWATGNNRVRLKRPHSDNRTRI